MKDTIKLTLAGATAGAINGLFGAGGGMILVPLLTSMKDLDEDSVFPASVSIILPLSLVSLILGSTKHLPCLAALPYLIGAVGGGILAGITGNRIPVQWLHRILGIMILWGGFRYLC